MRLNNIFISMLFTLYSSTIPKLDNNKYENDIFSIPYMGLPTEVTVNTVNTIPNVKNERIKSKAIFFKSIFKKYVLKLTKTSPRSLEGLRHLCYFFCHLFFIYYVYLLRGVIYFHLFLFNMYTCFAKKNT